jgi:hypothetical protein
MVIMDTGASLGRTRRSRRSRYTVIKNYSRNATCSFPREVDGAGSLVDSRQSP